MPFTSRSQLGACYKKHDTRWNCDEWLEKTPSVCALPYRKGIQTKSRNIRVGERIIGKVQTGSRGGRFFTITEKDNKGVICVIKVYLPKNK